MYIIYKYPMWWRVQLRHGRLALGRQRKIGEFKFAALGVRTDHVGLFGLQESQSLWTRTVRIDAHREVCIVVVVRLAMCARMLFASPVTRERRHESERRGHRENAQRDTSGLCFITMHSFPVLRDLKTVRRHPVTVWRQNMSATKRVSITR